MEPRTLIKIMDIFTAAREKNRNELERCIRRASREVIQLHGPGLLTDVMDDIFDYYDDDTFDSIDIYEEMEHVIFPCVKMLVDAGATILPDHLCTTIHNNWGTIFHFYLQHARFNIDSASSNGNTALLTAVSHSRYEMVDTLIRRGASMTPPKHLFTYAPFVVSTIVYPIHFAATLNSPYMVKFLIDRGADPFVEDARYPSGSSFPTTALQWARAHGHHDTARFLEDLRICRDAYSLIKEDLYREFIAALYHPERLHRQGYFNVTDT